MEVVIKVGGELLAAGEAPALARDVRDLVEQGTRIAIVHGGGPQATELQKRLGQAPKLVSGRRVTDEATLEVVKMVVAGRVNVDLCGALTGAGVRAVGLHGAGAGLIRATRRPPRIVPGGGDRPVDFGLVGDVAGLNLALLDLLRGGGYVPVIACLGADAAGGALNINADTVARELAVALHAEALLMVTGVPGVLRDPADPSSRIPWLTAAEARAMMSDGSASGGMITKLDEALAALERGVPRVVVVGRLSPGDVVRSLAEPGAVGTVIAAA